MGPTLKKISVLTAGIVGAAAVLLLFWFFDYFEQLNSIAYDFTLRLAGPIQPSSPTLIVAIDEDSVHRIGQWPWSRDKLARLIEQVEKGSPLVIALDIFGLDEATKREADDALAQAIGQAKSIVLAARIDKIEGRESWRKPLPEFIKPNVLIGHPHADPDFDGITRRIYSAKYLAESGDPAVVPALAFQALRGAGLAIDPHFEEARAGIQLVRPQPVSIRFAGNPQTTFPQIPAWQVLEGSALPAAFHDRIVLIGATAEGLGDQWEFTPFSGSKQRMSGVEIHANAIETLYAHRWIREISARTLPAALSALTDGSYADPADYAYGFAFFVILAALFIVLWWLERRFEDIRFYTVSLLVGVAVVGASWALMKYLDTWFAFPPFLFAIVIAAPALGVSKLVRVNRDLDSKIENLSRWGELSSIREEWDPSERISRELPAGPVRDAWLRVLDAFQEEAGRRAAHRKNLLAAPWRNSRWRLGAVDFFNEELIRFLSFNSAILHSIEDVIIVSDVAGRVVYQNPAAERLENYREDAPFAPDYVSSLLDGRKYASVFAEVFAEPKTVAMEFISALDRRVYHVTLAPIARAGLVLSMHDATAQHELNLAKNEMVSLVSHELRTPLTSIVGYSEMLLKYELVQAKGQQFLAAIIDESHRLSQLIQSFLDIAYIESGRQKVSKTEFEIGPMFRDMMSVLQPVAAEKSIQVETPVETAARVHADRLLLYQALTNLVTNAIKYSPNGTTIRIAVTNGSVNVSFRVTDQGCGIPPEDTGRIFEKFYRRANKETQQQSGFGLGLAFVKEVALRHGGEVTVESEVGKGSTFTLQIPN